MLSRSLVKLFYVVLFLHAAGSSFAQEVLFPLSGNPVIKQYLKSHPVQTSSANRILTGADTISLPFVDDFSRVGIYPYNDLWLDSDVFVNTTYCDHPVTIGVATFDGIDKYGVPYDSSSGATDSADFLTSKPIHLNFAGDTTIWLSFYYQPQGLGDEPESGDSLTLQFRNSAGDWNVVWSQDGHPDTAFQRVNIHVADTGYLYDGFQFRFMNYATLNGNRDHWNVDYVILGKPRFANDSIRDNALINSQQSWLQHYQAMPYTHYKSLGVAQANEMKSSVTDTAFNINYGQTTLNYYATVNDQSGANLFTSPFNIQNTSSNSISLFTSLLSPFVFPSYSEDTATFFIKDFLTQNGNASLPSNDTNYYRQVFSNYYAYDDGSAETAFGIPELGAKIAYRFDVKMQDTLRGVQIYFNPVGDLVHLKLFKLCYWSSVDVATNSDNPVHITINQKPANIDSINGFATYLFDSLLVVPAGPMYVGWIQNDATLLGIGVDKNTVSTNNMFSFYAGYWHQSQVQGSWMMRPLFGDSIFKTIIGIDEPVASSFSCEVFPNPSADKVTLTIRAQNSASYSYQLFNAPGELILSGPVSGGRAVLSDLPNGFYFVRITDTKTKESVTKKLVVQHD